VNSVYRIPSWDENFESSKSRTFEFTRRVYMPNKQHGMGFTRIISEHDGAAIFGIWCMILQLCSQQKTPREGWLTEDGTDAGRPFDASDLALRWRRQEAEVARAIDFLSSDKIGWLKKLDASIRPVSVQYPSSTGKSASDLDSDLDLEGEGKADATPAPVVSKGITKAEAKKLLARLRLACDDIAIQEWVGFASDYAGQPGGDAAMSCIEWCVAKARKHSRTVRYAREIEDLGAVHLHHITKSLNGAISEV
jgi:hypothetical protein